ncbi:hypothetical protein ACH347_04185 [Saccharopolyspora sp. 5N102]
MIRGDLADDLAVVEIRLLPSDEAGLPFDALDCMASRRWTLRRLYAGLQT